MPKANIPFEDIGRTLSAPAGIRVKDLSKTVSEKTDAGVVPGCRAGACAACAMHRWKGWNSRAEPSVLDKRIRRENMAGQHARLTHQARR